MPIALFYKQGRDRTYNVEHKESGTEHTFICSLDVKLYSYVMHIVTNLSDFIAEKISFQTGWTYLKYCFP